jgi:hypothetical protein
MEAADDHAVDSVTQRVAELDLTPSMKTLENRLKNCNDDLRTERFRRQGLKTLIDFLVQYKDKPRSFFAGTSILNRLNNLIMYILDHDDLPLLSEKDIDDICDAGAVFTSFPERFRKWLAVPRIAQSRCTALDSDSDGSYSSDSQSGSPVAEDDLDVDDEDDNFDR